MNYHHRYSTSMIVVNDGKVSFLSLMSEEEDDDDEEEEEEKEEPSM